MSRHALLIPLLVASVVVGACGPDSAAAEGAGARSAQSRLIAPGATPVPHDGARSLWDGNAVQLLFADALASCAWSDTNEHIRQVIGHDEYMDQVILKMSGVTCKGSIVQPNSLSTGWIAMRARPECNRDPSNSAPRGVTIEPRSILTHESMDEYGFGGAETVTAILDLIAPSINLCIAQKLRAYSPGASGAEAILMSEAEQRELVAVTLERAQRAMLGLSVLGLALMPSPTDGQAVAQNADARAAVLRAWAQDPAKQGLVAQLGVDLAAAVELHSVLAVEMADMLARSASAKAPRGAGAASDAEEIWGPGSWRQRAMALLYGGYPLAEEPDGTTPWAEPTRKLSGSSVFGESWPPHWLAPFARHDIREPEVHLFQSLTGLLPRVDVRLDPTSGVSCFLVDVDETAKGLRQAVLEALDPSKPCASPGCLVKTDPNKPDELWRRYRIRPDHVRSYARYLADVLEPVCASQSQGSSLSSGLMDVDGDVSLSKGPGLGMRVLSTAAFVPKQVEQRATVFARAMPWRMPDAVHASVASWRQGFAYHADAASWRNEAYQRMGHVGALSAQIAVREALGSMEALASASNEAASIRSGFARHERRILEVVGATAGAVAVTLRPALTPQQEALLPIAADQSGRTYWDVDIVRAESDTWWALGSGEQMWIVAIEDLPWAAGLARFPARRAFGRTIDDLANAVAASAPNAAAQATVPSSPRQSGLRRYRARVGLRVGGEGPFGARSSHRIALVAQKRMAGGRREYRLLAGDLAPPYAPLLPDQGFYVGSGGRLGEIAARLLEPRAENPTQPEVDGFGLRTGWVPPTDASMFGATPGQTAVAHYLASAESAAKDASAAVDSAMNALLEQQKDVTSLGAATLRAAEVNRLEEAALCGENNPSCGQGAQTVEVPALAWNTRWSGSEEFRQCPIEPPPGFPPINVAGFEGHDKATFAILKKVYSDYVAAGRPQDAQVWSNTKYVQVPGQALETIGKGLQMLIGISVSAAGKGGADLAPKVTIDDLVATGLIHCHALQALSAVTGPATGTPGGGALVAIPKAVADVRDSATQPSFGEYAGGSLQGAFIEQWAALRMLRDLADEYMLAVAAAEAKVLAARVAATSTAALYHASCNPQKASEAERACWSFALGIPSYNSGPIIAYNQTCEALAAQVGPAIMAAHAEQAEAMARVSSYASKFTDAVKNVHLASAKASQLALATKLAKARNDLEVELTAMQQVTTSGLYRRFHSYDLWRAKALVESARLQAVAARRAVESRFAVDLSVMNASEPFVAPPATWADEVYAYDLSLPAAVGLSVGSAQPGGIYSNKLTDYVGNLRRFVEGYAVARPSASASEDVEVISVPGPYVRAQPAGDGAEPEVAFPDPRAMRWEVYCPAAAQWVRVVDLVPTLPPPRAHFQDLQPEPHWNDKPCGPQQPTKARAPLLLDPWGRLEGSVANEPYDSRYNVRWARFAVNLVGTGIKDCKKAKDPSACYAEPYVRYDLSHVGPAWVSGYDQEWHLFAIPTGSVEGAKAVAAEQWVDPLTTSFSKPFLEAAARRELAERPLGGAYVLELDLGPEVRLDRIERVQILAATTYWVRQQ